MEEERRQRQRRSREELSDGDGGMATGPVERAGGADFERWQEEI